VEHQAVAPVPLVPYRLIPVVAVRLVAAILEEAPPVAVLLPAEAEALHPAVAPEDDVKR
jgi:hypothetical protein